MDKFYYLVAQLPVLEFSVFSDITYSVFLEEAAKWTKPKEKTVLENLDINGLSSGSGSFAILKDYMRYGESLNEEVSVWRKVKKEGQDYRTYPEIAVILAEHNPLSVETALLRLRWDFLKEKEVGHIFDMDGLIIYGLKLKILERLNKFNKEKGENVFQKICEGENEQRKR